MTAAETSRYYRASRGCHAAWLRTQPQLVIEGALDWVDAGTDTVSASTLSSAALLGSPQPHLPGRGSRSIPPKEDK